MALLHVYGIMYCHTPAVPHKLHGCTPWDIRGGICGGRLSPPPYVIIIDELLPYGTCTGPHPPTPLTPNYTILHSIIVKLMVTRIMPFVPRMYCVVRLYYLD